ncbi:hypothetical protein D3C85_900210 [compost metagenome]
MIARLHAVKQRCQRQGAVAHAALVADVLDDLDVPGLGMGEQLGAAPDPLVRAEFQSQLGALRTATQTQQGRQHYTQAQLCRARASFSWS